MADNNTAQQITHFVDAVNEVFAALQEDFRPRGRKRRVNRDAAQLDFEIDQGFAVNGRLSIQIRFIQEFEVWVSLSSGSTARSIEKQIAQNNVMGELTALAARAKAELEDALPSSSRYSEEFQGAVYRTLIGLFTAEEAAERLAKND